MWSRDGGSVTLTKEGQFNEAFTEGWQVTHTPDATQDEVINAPGIPAAGTSMQGKPWTVCRRADPQRVSPIMSIVVITYEGEPDPLAQPPIINWSNTTSTEGIDQDFDGKPIVTVLGEPIEGVTMELSDQVLRVKRNFASFSPHIINPYLHSVSSDVFENFAAGMARITSYNADLVYSNSGSYYEVSATIVFRYPYNCTAEQAWHGRIRHEGYYARDLSGRPARATDSAGEPVVRPVQLRLDGYPETNINNAVWLKIKRYGALPYNALGLL
jgi:hypothetical protein